MLLYWPRCREKSCIVLHSARSIGLSCSKSQLISLQEANTLFTSINEALSKLEEQCRLQTVPEMDEAALQLLRSDLATQGDSLSDDVVSLCATLESFISRDEAEIDSPTVIPIFSSRFLPAFYESHP